MPRSRITAIVPPWAVEGGRVSIHGDDLPIAADRVPMVQVGEVEARVVRASPSQIDVIVPRGVEGHVPVRVAAVADETAFVDVAVLVATGVHIVDNPVADGQGTIYATFSGTRSQQSAVTIYRIRPDRAREPFVTTIAHPTSMAVAADGSLYVTDRFEGAVYRVDTEGRSETVATELGAPCGLAFSPEGALYIGDRSGSVLRLEASGVTSVVATLSPSIAAYHLAWGPDDRLYVAAPTLATRDPVYRIDPASRAVDTLPPQFGRPQGIAFDRFGRLYVCDAVAGSAGIFRVSLDRFVVEKVFAAPHVVGLCFNPAGGLVVAAAGALYRLDVSI